MRNLLRSPAVPHLLVLAIPVAAIGYASLSGSHLQAAYDATTTGMGSIALVLLAASGYMGWVLRRRPYDEQAIVRQTTVGLFGVDLLVDSFAFLVAISSPAGGLLISAIAASWLIVWSSPSRRLIRLTSSYVVKRSPAAVFAFVVDYRNLPRYRPECQSVDMITPGPIGAGTRFREHARLLDGTEIVAVEEIIVFEASKRMVISIADRPHRNFDEFTFDPVASATRVTHRYDYEYPFSAAALGGWFQVHTRQDSLRAAREAGQIRIKQILESDAH